MTFKLDNNINVVFISSDKSPSGLNLQEASHIILLDSLNTSKCCYITCHSNLELITKQKFEMVVDITISF